MVQACDGEYDVQEDLPQAMQLLGEMNSNVKQVNDLVESMLQKVKNGEMTTEYGLNYLEIKYHMLLNYLINITYIVLRKCSGQLIKNDPSIERLIEVRTVLEKIRPIDSKLRYQIDKLVKTATSGNVSATDATSFKPNPDNMETAANDDQSDDEDGAANTGASMARTRDGESSTDKYVPPKLTAVHYDGDESRQERLRKQQERAKKRALGMSIIQDLKEEFLDNPTEISGSSRAQQMLSSAQREKEEFLDNPTEISGSSRAQQMLSSAQREKEEYEETYLTRLPITKAEKLRQRKLTTLGTLGDEVTRFGDGEKSSKKKRKVGAAAGNKKHKKRRFK